MIAGVKMIMMYLLRGWDRPQQTPHAISGAPGIKTIAIETKTLTRHKTCASGMPNKLDDFLDFDFFNGS
jgi:hypothetical protein